METYEPASGRSTPTGLTLATYILEGMKGCFVLGFAALAAWGCSEDPNIAPAGGTSSSASSASGGGASGVGGRAAATGGGGGAPVALDHYLYVSNSASDSITVFSIDPESGALSELDDVALVGGPGALAVDRSRQFLFAGLRNAKAVATLAIDPRSGLLTPVDSAAVGLNPVYLSVDATGQNLLLADYGADTVAVHRIEASGAVDPVPADVETTDTNPHAIVVSADNAFALVPNTNADAIFQYVFDAQSGELSANTPSQIGTPAGQGPRHLVFHPEGNHLYVVNEHADSVTTYAYDTAGGTLSALDTVSTLPAGADGSANTCADIHVSDDGAFVYASNRGHDSLAVFAVNPGDKLLSPAGHQSTEPIPREFELALGGRYVYAAGQDSDRLAAYAADATTGLLTPIDTYDVGDAPLWVLWVALPSH